MLMNYYGKYCNCCQDIEEKRKYFLEHVQGIKEVVYNV